MYCKNCGVFMNENQAFCTKCGVAAGTGKHFCPNCGKPVAQEAVVCVNCGIALEAPSRAEAEGMTVNTAGLAERSIVSAVLLSIFTCGIYALYWFVCLTNDMNRASGKENDTNGITAVLLTIVTCGIYGVYWGYKLGEKRDAIANERSSANILYLVLMFLGLGIVVYALAQDTLNKAIAKK